MINLRPFYLVNFIVALLLMMPLSGLLAQKKKIEDLDKQVFEEIYLKPRLEIEIVKSKKQGVSTAGRGDAQDPVLVPATVVSITEELITSRAYQSLWDILQDLPGMKADYQVLPESFNRTTFRGVVGVDKYLILLDGIRISSPTNEEIPILENYPVHLAKQVEILYGPASALYGADAFAGVINIITKTADDIGNAEASLSLGMYDKYLGNVLLGHRFSPKVSFTLSGQYSFDQQPNLSKFYEEEFAGIDSLKSGSFKTFVEEVYTPISQVRTDYSIPISNYALQGSLRLENLWNNDLLRINYFQNQSRTPSVAGMNPNNAVYNAQNYMSHRILMGNINYIKTFEEAGIQLNTLLTASRYLLDPESGFQNTYTQMERSYRFATGRMYQLEQLLSWNPNSLPELSVVAGFNYQNFRSVPLSIDLPEPVSNFQNPSGVWFDTVLEGTQLSEILEDLPGNQLPEGVSAEGLPVNFFEQYYHNIGGFVQMQYALLKSKSSDAKNLILTLGGRLDRNSRFKTEFTPRLGLVWSPFDNKQTIFKFLYGRALLEPSPQVSFEQSGTFIEPEVFDGKIDYISFYIKQPNPDLEPERAQTFELSAQSKVKNFKISLQAYYSKQSNLIVSIPADTTLYSRANFFQNPGISTEILDVQTNVNQNQGASYVYGGTLQISYALPFSGFNHFTAYTSLSYTGGSVQAYFTDDYIFDVDSGIFLPDIDTVRSELPFISPWAFRLGFDLRLGKLRFSPRFVYFDRQTLEIFASDDPEKRESIPGYTRLDMSAVYQLNKEISFFFKLENALDNRYKQATLSGIFRQQSETVGLSSQEFFERGSPQNPLRLSGGVSIRL